MTPKETVLEMIRRLPDDVALPEIMAALYLQLKIARGLEEIETGKGIPHEQVLARLQKWLT